MLHFLITVVYLDTPPDLRSFTALLHDPAFEPFVPMLETCWSHVLTFCDWLHAQYNEQAHPEIFEALNDATIILENVALIFQIDLVGHTPFGAKPPSTEAEPAVGDDTMPSATEPIATEVPDLGLIAWLYNSFCDFSYLRNFKLLASAFDGPAPSRGDLMEHLFLCRA
eukprot:s2094_g5.t1